MTSPRSSSNLLVFYLPCILTSAHHRLSHPPQTLDELGDSLSLLEQLQNDLAKIEARFPPLHEQFANLYFTLPLPITD